MKNVFYQTEKAGGGASPQAAAPRFLKMKRLFALLFALSLGMQWAYAFDFTNSSGGKTFYYNIIDASNRYVEVTYPNTSSDPWGGYTKPTGYWTLLSAAIYQGQTYTVTRIGNYAFQNCTGLTSVTIPNSVTQIGTHAFRGCTGLSSVSIPGSVTLIGYNAFQNCTGLTSVTLNYGLNTIDSDTFSGCTGLTSVSLPNSLTDIGSYAFDGCTGLTSVTIPGRVTTIGISAHHTGVPR